jgi:hypothetical protein
MGLFTPRQQLRDMQQVAAGQLLKGGPVDPAEQQKYLAQAVAASMLLGTPVRVVDDSLAIDPITLDDTLF